MTRLARCKLPNDFGSPPPTSTDRSFEDKMNFSYKPSTLMDVPIILRFSYLFSFFSLVFLAFSVHSLEAQVNVTMYHNDIGRTGQNLAETILNPNNVNAGTFGKLFSQPVDGQVYAQPLYVSGLTINGSQHNVLLVATENDSVYAFDADSNGGPTLGVLWKASLLSSAYGATPGATTISTASLGPDMAPQVGITGTPVVDASTRTLYVVSTSYENGRAIQRLHALDILTGAEKLGGPVQITATIPGTGNGSVNGQLTFDPMWENQRGGLLLLNGIIYVPYASHGDNGPWHGWVIAYRASTLQQTGAYCASPNGTGSGIWGGGAGLAADQVDPVNHPFGRMYVPTGNGDFNAKPPYTNAMDYGDSHIALDLSNGLPTPVDAFTTYQQAKLDAADQDQGSGGIMLLPDQQGPYPHLAIQAGKSGTIFVLNRDNLGGYNTSNDQVVQSLVYSVGNLGAWSSPAYWNGNVYYWGRSDYLKSFSIANGLLSSSPTSSTEQYGYPGSTPSVSANGAVDGIVWSIDGTGYSSQSPAVLQAHDANNVASTLYSSSTNAARDAAGSAIKFAVPTIANGKVFVGTSTEVDVYGLLNGQAQAAPPTFSPGGGSFLNSVNVTLSTTTPDARIYYSTDGTRPNAASIMYAGPIAVNSTETIKAVVSASGMLLSSVASATFTNTTQTPAVTFSLPTGTYTTAQFVTLSDPATNTAIYYTTDGSTPTTSSPVYSSPIAVTGTTTITAIGIAPGLTASPVLSQTYTIQIGSTGIAFGEGFAGSQGAMIFNGSTGLDDTRLQLTSGGLNQAGTAWYSQPVSVSSFTNDFAFQLSNPAANGITFTIQNSAKKSAALGGSGSRLGYSPTSNSVAIKFDLYNSAGEGPNSTGLYVNGAVPTVPAIDLTQTGINLHSGDTMSVHMVYDGATLSMTVTDIVTAASWSTAWSINIPTTIGSTTAYVGFTGGTGGKTSSQKILTWSYVTGSGAAAAATPVISPAGGTYSTGQTITLSDSTPNSTIYYTTDGTAPTTSSSTYNGSITVTASTTIKAVAVVSGLNNSAVGSANFTIASPAAPPTFTPSGGSYGGSQSVALQDATPGAVIHYTVNGSTPTAYSNVYSTPLVVSSSETIQAIATANGYSASAVSAASYTFTKTAASPTFTPSSGTYSSGQTVAISDSLPGASYYYTTNGTTPTTGSTLYTGPISVTTSQTLSAIAVASGYTNSAPASASYMISTSTPSIDFSSGFTGANLHLFGSKVINNYLQITDGTSNEARVAWFYNPVNVQSFTTDFNFQIPSSTADGFTFAIQDAPAGLSAVGGSGSLLGYGNIAKSIAIKFDLHSNAGEGSDSTGFYINGATPTLPSVDMTSSGVSLHSGNVLHAHITYDGTTLALNLSDTKTGASFSTSTTINIPAIVGNNTAYVGFTGGTGGQAAIQNVLNWTFLAGS